MKEGLGVEGVAANLARDLSLKTAAIAADSKHEIRKMIGELNTEEETVLDDPFLHTFRVPCESNVTVFWDGGTTAVTVEPVLSPPGCANERPAYVSLDCSYSCGVIDVGAFAAAAVTACNHELV